MAAHQQLREAIREKLGGISRQALDQRVKVLQSKLPMSANDAVAVIGHRNGVDVSRFLDPEALARVSGYVSQLNQGPAGRRARGGLPAASKQVVVQVGGVNVETVPGMTAVHAKEARVMAEKVYPLLYVFENSARDIITGVLTAGEGADWWAKLVPGPIQKEAAKRMRKEGREAWHSKRSADPIQYVDLPHLAAIVREPAAWRHFAALFPRQTWFDSVVDDMNVSRRVVAHMNPLSSDDIKSVENGFRKWVKQLQAKAADLS